MALSRVIRTGNGTTTEFVVDFALGYLDEDNVTARVGDEVDGAGNPIYRTITFLSDTLMRISGAPAGNGVRVVFERTVEKEDTIVHFSNGDVMDEENLDLSFKQILMVVHEVLDGRFGQFDSNLDMGGFVIKNMGAPVDPLDAANKQYVDGRLATNETLLAQTITARNAAQAAATSSQTSANASETSRQESAASATTAAQQATIATNQATASGNSATASQTARTGAETARTGAETALASTITARDVTLGYRNTASTHATNAGNSATASAGSAAASETSRQASGTSATNSANSATASQTSRLASEAARDASIGYRDSALTAANNAATASDTAADYMGLAYAWSSQAEDVQVDDGTRTGYSAYHWSKKAELAAGGGVSSWAGLAGTITTAQAIAALPFSSYLPLAGGSMTGRLVLPAATASGAFLQLTHGAAPTTPVNGEVWTTTAGLFYRLNGTTRQSYDAGSLTTMTAAIAQAGTSTTVQSITGQVLRAGIVAYAQKLPTVSTADPSGGADGDVWFKV